MPLIIFLLVWMVIAWLQFMGFIPVEYKGLPLEFGGSFPGIITLVGIALMLLCAQVQKKER